MALDVLPLETSHVPALLPLLREHLQWAGYPFVASRRNIAARLHASLGGDGLYTNNRRWAQWVAVDGDQVLGAVRAYAVDWPIPEVEHARVVPGQIPWLLFRPGRGDAGRALLAQAAAWLGPDWEGAEAFDLAHSLGWGAGLPAAWGHVEEVVSDAGFIPAGTASLMWGTPSRARFTASAQVPLIITLGRQQGRWNFVTRVGGQQVGELHVTTMRGTGWTPTWPGRRWIDWVHVDEAHRRQGIATALFAALAEHVAERHIPGIAGASHHQAAIRLNERLGLTARIELGRFRRSAG